MSAGQNAARADGLRRMISPRSVAVVGASTRAGHFANQPILNLRRYGFAGEVYPVNPRHADVCGYQCYPALDALPAVPDLVVVVVPPRLAVDAVRASAALGVGGAVVVGSGFAETSSQEGHDLQDELGQVVARSRIRLCGPNTLGVANFGTGAVSFASGNIPAAPRIGPIAVVSQSGGCSFTLLNRAWRSGVGVSHVAVAGNELDISIPEFIEYYLGLDEVKAVACYIEAIRDPAGLRRVGQLAADLGKSVFVMKAGVSEPGKRAAAAHTGALATSDAVCDAAFGQWGLIRARTFDELIGAAALAARFGPVDAQKFGVYAQGGGVAVVASDLFAGADLQLAQLSLATAGRLKKLMPDTTPGNPFDSGGQFLAAGAGVLTEALTDFAADPDVSAVAYFLMPVAGVRLEVYTEGILNAAAGSAKPSVVLQYSAGALTQPATDRILDAGVLLLDPPEAGVSALRLWSGSAGHRRRARREPSRLTDPAVAIRARDLAAAWRASGRLTISEHDAGDLLELYGIARVRQLLVTSESQMAAAAGCLRPPYVVKISSDDVPHRSQAGGVVTGVPDARAAVDAYQDVRRNVLQEHPAATIDGVTISETAPRGQELIVGSRLDPTFGPTVMLGRGGIETEAWADSAVRLPPLDHRAAGEMIDGLRVAPLLRPSPGRPGCDLDALAEVAIRVGELALDLGEALLAFELNPVIAGPVGNGVTAVDALIELSPPG